MAMDKHNLLHPYIDVKNLKKKDEVLLINGTENGKFEILFLDAQFQSLPEPMNVPVKDLSNFLDSFYCQNLKAVIFLIADFTNGSDNVDLQFRQMVYEDVRKRKCHFCLVDPMRISNMSMLFAANLTLKPGDVILSVLCMGQMVNVAELQRKQEGYSYINYRMINRFNRNVNDVAAEILGTCNPSYVIVCDPYGYDLVMSLKRRVVPSNIVVFYPDLESITEYTFPVLKTIFERGYNQIIPFTLETFAVTNESNYTVPEQAVIVVNNGEVVPLEKVQIVPKSKKPYIVVFLDTISASYKPAGEAQLSKEQGHRIKLALVIDRNSLPFLYQEPFIIPEIEALPKKLATQPDLNVPVIGFYDNSSIICVPDENGYMFLNEWNDLVKVLSMPADDLKVDPKWRFKVITNDPEHPVLLQFETFLGSRKSSTPLFLMALLLKHHIKAIKKETGKKPKKLGFCLFNDFTDEEKKRIQIGLEEACKLLKIDFVFVSNV